MRFSLVAAVLLASSSTSLLLSAQDSSAPRTPATAAAPPAAKAPFDQPTTPLDARVDPAKITTQGLPRLPEPIAQPLPVIARIARSPEQVPISRDHYAAARAAIDKGLAYLRGSQRPSGAWMEKDAVQPTDQPRASSAAVAVTAMGSKAFIQAATEDATAKRALAFVVGRVREQGYDKLAEGGVGTYTTSAVLSALALSGDASYAEEVRGAIDWLRTTQWDQSEGIRPEQDWFGGAGYGRNKRPDLSNTQLMLDALHDAGVSPDDAAVQKALAFVTRAQNLPSSNDATWARNGATTPKAIPAPTPTPAPGGAAADPTGKGAPSSPPTGSAPGSGTSTPPSTPGAASTTPPTAATSDGAHATIADGGFIYTPSNGGESFASEKAGEGRFGEKMPPGSRSLRSYGSMTYAGFKSMLYAGLSRDDERVKAAFDWICSNYTFDQNPGLGQEGLYYYYHVMSRALLAAQQHEIPVHRPTASAASSTGGAAASNATTRNWREDLITALVSRQHADGSWVNSSERWEESQPDLVTIYALLALEEAIKPVLQTE